MKILPDISELLDIISSISDPVIILDPDLHFIYANQAYCSYMGLDHDNILKMAVKDVIADEYVDILYSKYRAISADNPVFDNIYPSIMPTGEILVEKWHNTGAFDDDGNLKYYYCVANLKAENETAPLTLSSTNLVSSTLIRSSLLGILIAIDDQIIYINPKFWELLGAEETGLGSSPLLSVLFGRIFNDKAELILGSTEGAKENIEIEYEHPDGHDCWLSIIRRRQSFKGNAADLYIVEDISEQKLNEIETETARKNLADMMRIAKVGYWENDLINNRWIWSAETYQIYNIQQGTLITDGVIKNALQPDEQKKREQRIEKILQSDQAQESFPFEYPIYAGTDQERWIAGEAFYERNGTSGDKRFFGWVQDITDRKTIEQELIRAKNKAEESERLKTNFLANMSHEIRTPLNAILGFSDLLTRATVPEEQEKFKSIINQSSSLLLKIIDDILDFSSIESGSLELNIETVSVSALFNEIGNIYSDRNTPELKFTVRQPEREFFVSADRERLKQVLINLINNSFKYTEAGKIEISCRNGRGGSYKEFSVKDTGIGIQPEQAESIFERFYQADSFSKGTGLGLAITKSIIDQMNGHILVKSEPGKGSDFIFALPAADQP